MATLERSVIEDAEWDVIDPGGDEEAPFGRFKNGKPRKTPAKQSESKPGRKPGKSLTSLRDPLADRMVEYLGPPLSLISPLSVAVLDERAERTADALISLGLRRPRIAKMIERFIEGSSTYDLGATVVGIGVAIQVDHERMRPDSGMARYFNLDKHWQETYGDLPERPEPVADHGLMDQI